MKPASFHYCKPNSSEEVFALLRDHRDAVVLAGGQSLVAMLNMRLVSPSHVIDITGLSELKGQSLADGWLRLGALTRHADVMTSELVAAQAPLLAQAAAEIGHPAIRNRGTVGGSLALADPAAELPACLLALGGRVEVAGPEGRRHVDAVDFFQGPFQTALGNSEILTAVEVPVQKANQRCAIDELARRHGDYALAGLAVQGNFDDGRVAGLRLAYFGVGDRPVLAQAAAAALEGKELDAAAIEAAANGLAQDVEPIGQPGCSGATKIHLASVLTKRVLNRLAA